MPDTPSPADVPFPDPTPASTPTLPLDLQKIVLQARVDGRKALLQTLLDVAKARETATPPASASVASPAAPASAATGPSPTAPPRGQQSSTGVVDWQALWTEAPPVPDAWTPSEDQHDLRAAQYQARLGAYTASYQSRLDAVKAQQTLQQDLARAQWTNEYTLRQALQAGYVAVAQGAIDRARDSAKFVQTAATAIGSLYTGLLALTYRTGLGAQSSTPNGVKQLWDSRALIPALYLGLAIALATAYLAYLAHGTPTAAPGGSDDLTELATQRLDVYLRWVHEAVVRQRYLLQVAVLSLSAGVIALPAPFVSVAADNERLLWVLAVVALVPLFLLPLMIGAAGWLWQRYVQQPLSTRRARTIDRLAQEAQRAVARAQAAVEQAYAHDDPIVTPKVLNAAAEADEAAQRVQQLAGQAAAAARATLSLTAAAREDAATARDASSRAVNALR